MIDKRKLYNEKEFLASESAIEYLESKSKPETILWSCENYHATICPENIASFRINDCNGGVLIRHDLNNRVQARLMVSKLEALSEAIGYFSRHIKFYYMGG